MESNQQENKSQEYYQLFQHWRHTIGYCYKRRLLEAHPVLVGPALEHLSSMDEIRQSEDFEFLQRIHQRGGSIQAIREVYVDWYGGLALDLPSWLEKLEDEYNDLIYSRPPHETVEKRIMLLQEAIKRSEEDETVAPETLADLCNKLAIALKHYGVGESRAIESAIALHEAALLVFQRERYPRQWAMQQANLGTAYAYRVAGEKRSNREKAIAYFKFALQVYTPLNPREYATTLTNLGVAYQDRIEGDPRENIEASLHCLLTALRIRTRKAFPVSHAATLDKLGSAYHRRLVGSQRQNKEKAIYCYLAALSIYESKHLLADQAMVLSNLGLIYRDRVAGLRSENLEQSIRYFEKALAIYTPQYFPLEWALAQLNLGVVNTYRLRGTRRDNLEEAIVHLKRSLLVLNMQDSPSGYGEALNSLGNTYKVRIGGDRRENLEEAVKYFTQALQIHTRDSLPEAYAATQNNLGGTYGEMSRLPGKRSQYIEDAIHAYTEALQIYTREKLPNNYAMTLGNLGVAYYSRLVGDSSWNQEEAIKCFQEALQVYVPVEYPLEYATMQDNLGLVYWRRVKGDRQTNLATALVCHMKALDLYTLDEFPLEYRNVHLNMASLAFEEMIPDAQKSGDIQQLHAACTLAQEHYALARQTQLMLGWLESDEQGRASLQGFYFATREMYARESWCLWTLGRLREAAIVLEAGRAQALTEAQLLGGVVLEQVCPEHTTDFETARRDFQHARLEGDRVQKRATRDEFLRVKKAIEEHCQPNFLPDLLKYHEITSAAAADQTLIYLATAQYGGFALIIPQANSHPDGMDRLPIALSLPDLTWETVDEWITTHAQQGGVIGGYKFALRRQGLELLLIWLIAEESQEEYERRVATPLRQMKSLLPDEPTPLKLAMTDTLATLAQINEDLAGAQQAETNQTLDLPLDTWLADKALRKLLQQHLAWNLQKRAIAFLLLELSTTIMEPLRQYLDELGLTARNQRLAFIPCGRLGIFPLHAAPVGPEQLPFAETCEMTYQASARVLTAVRAAALAISAHGAVLAVGGPHHAGSTTLPCAEAEAEAIVRVARQARWRASVCLRGVQATKALFLKKLADIRQTPGVWLHLASHGRASINDPHESYMELSGFDAQGKKARLTLATLQRERSLVGIWGVTASGCVTGLNDLELAPDELGSFAAGLLQAGAVCVVATLWSVKDHATALLMVRFHELRFTNVSLSAAAALREAVRWLRTATRSQLDAFARAQRLPELSAIDPVRDAMRGSDLAELPEDSSTETTFSHHISKEAASLLISLPYDHPVYWAGPIIYGV